MSKHASAPQALRIYLSDHRAAATAECALAARFAKSNRGSPFEDAARQLSDDLAEDAAALDRVIDHLGVTVNPARRVAAALGERVGRLKLNGQLRGYSPLSRLVEIEALLAAVAVKRALWATLRKVAGSIDLGGVDLQAMATRADEQRTRLTDLHREASAGLFSEAASRTPAPG